MAEKKVYIGSIGPFLFDDADDVDDPDGDFVGETQKAALSDADMQADSFIGSPTSLDINDFLSGTAGEIEVVDDGDQTATLRGNGENTETSFNIVVALQAGGAGGIGLQYKTRAVTLSRGIVTDVGSESSWNDL